MLAKPTFTLVYERFSNVKKLSISKLNYLYFTAQIFSKSGYDSANRGKRSNFIAYCNSRITKNGRSGNIKEAESIFSRMPNRNTISWTAMLTAYAENGQIRKARKTFDEMPERTTASYNAMITAYIRNRCNVDEAYKLFTVLSERNAVSYAAMITGFIRAGMFDQAEKLYSETPLQMRDPVCSNALISGYLKNNKLNEAVRIFQGMGDRDVISWSSMIDGFCKGRRIHDARNLFDKMPDRNVVSWSTMIDGYMEKGCFEEGFELFLNMRRESRVEINSTTMTIMCKACGSCGRTQEGLQIHGLTLHMGFEFDAILSNSIITMYCMFGYTDMANKIFCTMNKKDIVSWNSLISGYIQNSQVEEAYKLFERMPEKDLISWTAIISGFSMTGKIGKAIELFDMIPEKDDIVWTATISGFVNNGEYEEALRWFVRMCQEGYKPNTMTFSTVIAASAALVALSQGLQFHIHALKMNLESDLSVQNSLISMYSKCGNIIDAYRIFRDITQPNVISYNSIITGFAQNGFGEEGLGIYEKMQHEGHQPNHVTFLAVLSACTHVGLVEEGRHYFKSMKSQYGIEPGVDHYACMVDLLGRAGLLDEAVDLIHSMPLKPHAGVWGAILGASMTHSRLDLAKLAAQRISELEPANATPYVVLSDLYSDAGKQTEGNHVRMTKNLKGIKKIPGCSWVAV
ncbi:hypothetical protein L6164_018227 [Bauhinia variegata]|uniref:Uncharacterized protein n=1 Tax=Bauhinia variegata TaxID=167791 RepID=A0ACB9NBV2_BAUVA|nr:hypothetical protein L6164_018227 [Bauhinia variegata]